MGRQVRARRRCASRALVTRWMGRVRMVRKLCHRHNNNFRRVERLRAASPYGHKADWRLVAFIVKARDELLQARAVVVAGGPRSS